MNRINYVEPVASDTCFCCGKDNRQGLKLEFIYPEEGKAETAFTVPDYFSGWKNVVHGGFLSMLLDEVMAHACRGKAAMAVTGELRVKFRTPLHIGETCSIHGEVTGIRGRLIDTAGKVMNDRGECCAEGTARFLEIKSSQMRENPE